MTTKEFCRKFRACEKGTRFALKYKTMRECYDALLNGEAGENSCTWAVWTYVRVVNKKETVRFALWCVNRVRHLMTDKRSTAALDAVQRWINGERVDFKGFAAAADHAANHAAATADCAFASGEAERDTQIAHLRELGNPFEEKAKNSYHPAYPAYKQPKKEGEK